MGEAHTPQGRVTAEEVGEGTERFVPGHTTFPHSAEQHLKRYEWAASQLTSAQYILDVACGVGYGSRMLRDRLDAQVVGCDLSPRAIEFATAEYGRPGLDFVQDDCQKLSRLPDRGFDAAVSFETLEHVPDRLAFVSALHRVLAPRGKLLVSTPDRRLTSVLYPITGKPHCGHHLVEFDLEEFIHVMSERFVVREVWGQSFVPKRWVIMPVQIAVKGAAHKFFGEPGRRFLERRYWRGTGTHVQAASDNRGMIANFNVLVCEAR